MPDYTLENSLQGIVAGIDEAGRGPWAGPVVAAAVILQPDAIPEGINDSKKLSAVKREQLFERIYANAMVGVGVCSVEEIDALNILGATKCAMSRALHNLPIMPDIALVDGNQLPVLPCEARAVVKGDSISLSIAAASIIAKVTRDRIMQELDSIYPGYRFSTNAGYGTPEHQNALQVLGVTPHHRKSFAPVKKLLLEA